ncbi:hypothetical protein EAF04_003056 [Stromatinia cepivora]|nr:hypothetical protein EAF04_003056 [Stromatinia cepivora]
MESPKIEPQSLEFQLNKLNVEDAFFIKTAAPGSEKDNVGEAARVWENFSAQVDAGVDRQRSLIVSTKESLLLRSQILSLPKPSPQSIDAFTSLFNTKTPFLGPSYELLSSSGSLLSLKLDSEDPDRLLIFIQRCFGYYLAVPDPTRPPSWQPLYYFPARRVARIVAAALLVVGAILTLYYIYPKYRDEEKRSCSWCFPFTTSFAIAMAVTGTADECEEEKFWRHGCLCSGVGGVFGCIVTVVFSDEFRF